MNKLITLLLICTSKIASFLLRNPSPHKPSLYRFSLPASSCASSSSFLTEATKEDTACTTQTTAIDIEDFPYSVSVSNTCDSSWIKEATSHLQEHGICVLLMNNEEERASMDCRAANEAATSRLSKLKKHITNYRGIDPDGQDEPFRFLEVVSRDDSGGRYDMPVSWKNSQNFGGVPLTDLESKAITNFHNKIESIVQPVIDSLWKDETDSHVAASGFLINQPGSTNQNWHRDGPNEGLINVFVPLVDLTMDMGPTEVWSKTHLSSKELSRTSEYPESNKMAPLMKQSQILLMDYRTYHRGLGNTSKNMTRTLAYAVYHKGSSSLGDKLSYGVLPRTYQSIEAADVNAQTIFPFSVTITKNHDNEWIQKAALLLRQDGVCVLSSGEEEELLDSVTCREVNNAAISRLSELQRKIANRGVDPSGSFRFLEVVRKEDGGGRLDMPISWKNQEDLGTPLSATESKVITEFHVRIQDIVQPVLNKLWNESYRVTSSGFLVNEPGSSHQIWHRDGSKDGSITVLCPLVDMTKEIGPIEVWPKSHASSVKADHSDDKVAPLLKRGQIMLMDFRTLRQYLGNASQDTTWIVAYAILQKRSSSDFGDMIHSSTDAVTLEYD